MNLSPSLSFLKRVTVLVVGMSLFLAAALQVSAQVQAGKVAPGPVIQVTGVSSLASSYNGPEDAVRALQTGQAQPLSLVSSDFDEDGFSDLIVGYAAPSGGVLSWHRGNIEAFAPQTEESFKAMSAGNYQSPVLPGASTFRATVRPDLVAAGDFYQSGHHGLIVAARGANTLNLLAGDGHGRFADPEIVKLPGAVTALGSGKLGLTGSPTAVLIGVQGTKPLLLLYRSTPTGLVLENSYSLSAPATAFAFGDLHGHMVPDEAAVVAGGQVYILHSSGNSAPVLRQVSLPFSVSAITLGSFLFDRNRRLQMALLSPDGTIHVMAPSGFDSLPWTADDMKMLQQVRLGKAPSPFHPLSNNQDESWQEIEVFRGVAPFSAGSRVPTLVRSRSGGSGGDDLTVFNHDADQTILVSHRYSQQGAPGFTAGQPQVQSGSAKAVVGAVPMRLNAATPFGVLAIRQGK